MFPLCSHLRFDDSCLLKERKMAGKKGGSGTKTVNKSAKTGKFVSDKAMKSNPAQNYKQTVKK
jgi:hypothetical protein